MKKLILLTVSFLATVVSFAQATIIINPAMDNSIYSESTGNSNALGKLYAGRTCDGNVRRALLYFDIAAEIPAGATITDVSLNLINDNVSLTPVSTDFSLYPVSTEWGEGTSSGGGTGDPATADDATWVDAKFGSTTWTAPGGDFGAAVATTTLPAFTGTYSWTSPAMVANVQNWLDAPATNFGWLLRDTEGTDCSARRFGSKDSGTAPLLLVEYICPAPTALCQNLSISLDAAGAASITGMDLDDGSSAVCGITDYTPSITDFSCADVGESYDMILTAVYDGPLTGGTPKGVEVYVINDIPDLSIYGIGFANNGGGTDGEEFTFPAVSGTAGQYIYIASEAPQFTAFFGFAPDYTDGAALINGDDAIELFRNGVVIDVFGDVDVDGTGQPWDYEDGWAYRNDLTLHSSPFTISNWTMSGTNVFDGETSNATAATPAPIGTYAPPAGSGIPVTLTITDGGLNTAQCAAFVEVLDDTPPTMSCTSATITLSTSGSAFVDPADLDGGTADNCGIDTMYASVDSVFCSDIGVMDIKLYALDVHGNLDSCTASVTIDGSAVLTITTVDLNDVTCNGASDGDIDIDVTGGGSGSFTYDWDNDGTGDFDDTQDLVDIDGGTYVVEVVDGDGCMGTMSFDVLEPDPVDTSLTLTGGTFTATATGVGYSWYDCTSMTNVPGENSQTFTPTTNGSYALVVNDGGCIDTSACYTITGIGFDELAQYGINLYPNPATAQLTVEVPVNLVSVVRLYSIQGEIVREVQIVDNRTLIDVSDLGSGVYAVHFVSQEQLPIELLIIE